jgi:hypothetical protein
LARKCFTRTANFCCYNQTWYFRVVKILGQDGKYHEVLLMCVIIFSTSYCFQWMIAPVLLCICSDMLRVDGSSLQSRFPRIFVCWTCVAVPRGLSAIGKWVTSMIFINHILCTSLSLHEYSIPYSSTYL